MAGLAKPPELKVIALMLTWSDPARDCGRAAVRSSSAPWPLMMGADALMRRHATDLLDLAGQPDLLISVCS
ncbi:hypothetical protein ACWD0J_08055 [Streptomyces sp. NPDC003011]